MFFSRVSSLIFLLGAIFQVNGFDNSRTDNLAVYYGQNSYGATHSDQANWQQRLSHYCQDDSIDVIPLAFLHVFFSTGGLPEINMANTCNAADNGVFPGTSLPNCQFLASDIQDCQARGKIVTLSLGGATGAAGFTSDAQAEQFADTVWNLFFEGSSSTRPYGNAVLDGLDLDIEGGSSNGFVAFARRFRSLANGGRKTYYLTAAPQCPYPDAYLGTVINAVGFDAIYVQFYNNFCGLTNYANPNAWNFEQWDTWAKTVSPNRNVKVYIGAPAHSTAAGSGFVDLNTLSNIARETRSRYSSFGGVMLWDASQAYANNRYDRAIKNAIRTGGSVPAPPTTTTTTTNPPPTTNPPTTTTTTANPPPTTTQPPTGTCAGVAAWSSSIAYTGGMQVVYNGHLWTAKWWSQADTPGGAAGVWTDNGPCAAKAAEPVKTNVATAAIWVTAAENMNVAGDRTTEAKDEGSAKATAAPEISSALKAEATAAEAEADYARRSNSRHFKL